MFGFDATPVIMFLLLGILPLVINGFLAKSRGKSVGLMLFLTIIFSWIVTLILAFLPKVEIKGELR